jgi:hypothetical protein
MRRLFVAVVAVGLANGWAQAQDTPRAKATRENLKKIVLEDVEYKEEMTRVIFDDLKRESNNKVSFIIDTGSGMSMNSRMSYKVKKASIEKILNDLADKNDFGWYVFSNPKDPNDQKNGKIILRKGAKGKERGYEFGTEPKEEKKSSALQPGQSPTATLPPAWLSHRGNASRGGSRWNFQPIPGR